MPTGVAGTRAKPVSVPFRLRTNALMLLALAEKGIVLMPPDMRSLAEDLLADAIALEDNVRAKPPRQRKATA